MAAVFAVILGEHEKDVGGVIVKTSPTLFGVQTVTNEDGKHQIELEI